jgi:hypothetical protein
MEDRYDLMTMFLESVKSVSCFLFLAQHCIALGEAELDIPGSLWSGRECLSDSKEGSQWKVAE